MTTRDPNMPMEVDIPGIHPEYVKIINSTAKKYAGIHCRIHQLQTKIENLREMQRKGETPKHLIYKFDKVYTDEHVTAFKTAILSEAIKADIHMLLEKHTALSTEFENRGPKLVDAITPIQQRTSVQANLSPEELLNLLNSTMEKFLIQYHWKMEQDEIKKQEKKDKFKAQQLAKEVRQEPSNENIRILQDKIKKLELKLKTTGKNQKGKAKGGRTAKPRSPTQNKTKKSPKASKGKNGNTRNTAARTK